VWELVYSLGCLGLSGALEMAAFSRDFKEFPVILISKANEMLHLSPRRAFFYALKQERVFFYALKQESAGTWLKDYFLRLKCSHTNPLQSVSLVSMVTGVLKTALGIVNGVKSLNYGAFENPLKCKIESSIFLAS